MAYDVEIISVKQAIQNAMQFIQENFGQDGLIGLRLEEVEMSEDGNLWLVTLSFIRGMEQGNLAASFGAFEKEREFKLVEVWSHGGEVRSVKIRQLV